MNTKHDTFEIAQMLTHLIYSIIGRTYADNFLFWPIN